MRDPYNIRQVAGLKPDYMGFIFYGKSPRFVGAELAIPELPASIQKVGVFVNEKIDTITGLVKKHKFSFVQLHGTESIGDCIKLKESGVGVIKAFSVDDEFDFHLVQAYKSAVDYVLFDTKGKFYGGNATSFNWKRLNEYDQRVPFFLSGGIGQTNGDELKTLSSLNLHAIDVNSGVESRPGLKDVSRLKELMRIVKPKS
jgi:phosphoribosylanthranilate isomerase